MQARMLFRENGALLDARRFPLERRGSLFIADAMSVHRSHLEHRIHSRFAEFDRRSQQWHALRALVLGTHTMTADAERVFDVLFYFGPMPLERARAWARVTALPRWAAPWPERGGFVEIAPALLRKTTGSKLCPRPCPSEVRAALGALDAELQRRELVRDEGTLIEFATSQWLDALRATLDGAPPERGVVAPAAATRKGASEIEQLIGKSHPAFVAWVKRMARHQLAWPHWTPLGTWTTQETLDRLVTERVTDELFCWLKRLPSPRSKQREITATARKGRPWTLPTPAPRGR